MGSGGVIKTMEMEALPKGFRFRPTDEELINHYLRLKINGRHSEVKVIPEVDVCRWKPWDLPGICSCIYKHISMCISIILSIDVCLWRTCAYMS